MKPRTYLGVDIGKTKISVGIVTDQGKILAKKMVATDVEKGAKKILEQCRLIIRDLLDEYLRKVSGIGIGSTGIVEHESGVVISSGSIPDWKNIKIKKIIETEFNLPVKVDNDVYAATLGEHLFGAGRGYETSVYITISTGVGAAFVRKGEIWRGAHGLAGQIAHLPLFNGETVNEVFGGKSISRKGNLTTERVFELAKRGNKAALEVIESAARGAAQMISWLQNTFDPEAFILGGSIALNQKEFIKKVKVLSEKFLEKYIHRIPGGDKN